MEIFSVNYHLTKACNMKCKGCYARYKSITGFGRLEEHIKILSEIVKYGIKNNLKKKKINFVGGEPTLVKELPLLIEFMNKAGFITSIVTNGSKITSEYLEKFKIKPDWIGVSIDSFNRKTNWSLGRITNLGGLLDYLVIAELIKSYGIKLKINTVVSKLNYRENMIKHIEKIMPERWKLFQYLPIAGENDEATGYLAISGDEFNEFLDAHRVLSHKIKIIPESNNQMKGSYLMISPDGRLFDNVDGILRYSGSLLDISFEEALKEVRYFENKLIARGGAYDW